MATMRSRRWQVWSLDPQSGRWMVVDGGPEATARGGAARKMATARRLNVVGAAYVALPSGEEPSAEHYGLAVTEDEVTPPGAGLKTERFSLSGNGTLPTPTGQASFVADVAEDGTSLTLRLEPAAGPDEGES